MSVSEEFNLKAEVQTLANSQSPFASSYVEMNDLLSRNQIAQSVVAMIVAMKEFELGWDAPLRPNGGIAREAFDARNAKRKAEKRTELLWKVYVTTEEFRELLDQIKADLDAAHSSVEFGSQEAIKIRAALKRVSLLDGPIRDMIRELDGTSEVKKKLIEAHQELVTVRKKNAEAARLVREMLIKKGLRNDARWGGLP